MKRKFPQIVELVHERLRTGEYSLDALPSERTLAETVGVSHMTARRAVQQLVRDGVLSRHPSSRRLRPGKGLAHVRSALQIAIVLPAFQSPSLQKWYFALEHIVAAERGLLRPIGFSSSLDPAITDALDGPYDGIFMIPPFDLPPLLLSRLERERNRIVSIARDLTHLGIPSLDAGAPRFIDHLVAHLAGLGHRRIDCLNAQPMNPLVQERIMQWQKSLLDRGLEGRLHNVPVKPFEAPQLQAMREMRETLASGHFNATALFTTTSAAAQGAMRAAYERGVVVGRDLSICTCDSDPDESILFTPSLTTLTNQDPRVSLRVGLDWIQRGGKVWNRPLKIEPKDTPLWHGESTGPCSGNPSGPGSENQSRLAGEASNTSASP